MQSISDFLAALFPFFFPAGVEFKSSIRRVVKNSVGVRVGGGGVGQEEKKTREPYFKINELHHPKKFRAEFANIHYREKKGNVTKTFSGGSESRIL